MNHGIPFALSSSHSHRPSKAGLRKLATLILLGIWFPVVAGERFVITTGAVQREIPADRLSMSVTITATDQTIEGSVTSLDQLLEEFRVEVLRLNYPSNAISLKERRTQKAREWVDQKWVSKGYSSIATLSVNLMSLTNYSKLLSYVGTREHYEISWMRMSSSVEGTARSESMAEALRAARVKATLLANEGGAKLGKLIEATEEPTETVDFSFSARNVRDPHEGTAVYPIEIVTKVRAKYELLGD